MSVKNSIKIAISIILLSIVLLVQHVYFPMAHKKDFPKYGNWDNGVVNHILPTANDCELLIKISGLKPFFAKTIKNQ